MFELNFSRAGEYKGLYLHNLKEVEKSINKNYLTFVTGGRGVGKTEMLKDIANEFSNLLYKVLVIVSNGNDAKSYRNTLNNSINVIKYGYGFEHMMRGSNYDIVLFDNFDNMEIRLNDFNDYFNPTYVNSKIIIFTTPDKRGIGSKIINNDNKVILINPLDEYVIRNLLTDIEHRSKNTEEIYYNYILGRYYDEKNMKTINNIKVNNTLYTLMLMRLVDYEKKYGKVMSVSEYILELIKQDILINMNQ